MSDIKEDHVEHTSIKIDVRFNGMLIQIEFNSWNQQNGRDSIYFKVYTKGDGRQLKDEDPIYKFIIANFKKTDLCKGVIEKYSTNTFKLKK